MVRDHWSNDVMVSMDCRGLYCIGSGTLGVGGPRNIEVFFGRRNKDYNEV